MAKLSTAVLLKHTYRTEKFIEKLENKSLFETCNGKMVELVYNLSDIDILQSLNRFKMNQLRLTDTEGFVYRLSDFVKTVEFGGKGARSGTVKEDQALHHLREQMNRIKIGNNSKTVPIMIGDTIYHAHDAESTSGTPKSDFHLVDENGTELAWISHKDGRKVTDHQQWGGISRRKEPVLHSHDESQAFINYVISEFPCGIPNATTIARKITDVQLQKMSVYGNRFGNEYGRQNVNIVLQGDIVLSSKDDYYEMTASHVHINGQDIAEDYTPTFMAIYKGDRNDFGIKGTRVVIAPLKSRKINSFV